MTAKAKKRAIVKDFSDLRPVEERIALTARGIMQVAFKGAALADWEPKAETQIHRAWKSQKLDERQQIAWRTFLDDIMTAEGISGKVGGSYGEYTDRGNDNSFKVPKAYINAQFKRLERLWSFLDRSERALLAELLQDTFQGKSSLKLETIGIVRSGYIDKESSRIAGVVHVQTLLSRLATFYSV